MCGALCEGGGSAAEVSDVAGGRGGSGVADEAGDLVDGFTGLGVQGGDN
jgi:hypothetical protein